MRTLPIIPLALGFTFATILGASGQGGANYNPNPSSPALDPGLSMPGRNSSTPKSGNTGTDDEDDPTLQRLKSSDSLGQGSMSRDEGQLTAKQRRREKVSRVESAKQLPTSGIDPKFQGSLLHSSVSSITDVGEKATSNASTEATDAEANSKVVDESDPRFKAKQLVFTPLTKDESKTGESPRTKADSSPSPSPSPSASVTPSSH